MYKVYCDNYLLYSPNLEEYILINPKLDIELNKTGSFTFSIYPNHPNYDRLQKLKSVITVYQDNKIIFRGRVLENEDGFYNQKQITCEGELAFLIDSVQRPYDYSENGISISQLFSHYINNHNLQVEDEKKFTVGVVDVLGDNIYISDYEYNNTWDSINKYLIDVFGGYLMIRHEQNGNYIDYLSDLTTSCSQNIEFGKNLLDLKKITKGADVGTIVIPLGAKVTETTEEGEEIETEERLTIASVNSGKDYLENSIAISKFGKILKKQIFDEITDAQTLKEKGQEFLGEVSNLPQSIELTAIDLKALQSDFDAFMIGCVVLIKSAPHNLNVSMLVNKLSIDIFNPQSNKITLGATFTTLTEQNNISKNNGINIISEITNKVSSKTTITDVNNVIDSKCYSKTQINLQRCQRISLSQNDGVNVINIALSQLTNDNKIFVLTICDGNNDFFVGTLLYIANSKATLTKLSGTLSCSANVNGTISIDGDLGTAPYNFNFYA